VEQGGVFAHGLTYSGHPVAAAVAIANLKALRDEGVVTRVKDDIGRDRPNIRLEYGGLVQGFRVVPFGQFATRLPAIGRIYNQSKVEYYTATPPAPAGQDATWYDEVYGRYSVAATYQDMTDLNDLKRRANKAAAKMARVGKQLALNLRPGALKVKDGWDICDSVYVDINRGVVSNPAASYVVNRNAEKVGHYTFAIDYEVTIPMRGGATVTMGAYDSNDVAIANHEHHVIAGVPPAPHTFDGQFFDVRVEKIERSN